MLVSNYKVRFHALSIYALLSTTMEFDRIQQFGKGLARYLQAAIVSTGGSRNLERNICYHQRDISHILTQMR